jgi:arsenate reductase (glutaredoxin)
MTTIYGIKQCSTMKKAMAWLDEMGIAYDFHDYKKAGLPEDRLDAWLDRLGWETVINRRGTTWRKLPETERNTMDRASARAAALANPSLVKRPVLVSDEILLIGFDPDQWREALS